MLKRIETKPVAVDPKAYDAYVGEYEVSPTFKVAVFKEGEKLMTQATNQPAFELFPDGEDKFFLRVVDAKVYFYSRRPGQGDGTDYPPGRARCTGKED